MKITRILIALLLVAGSITPTLACHELCMPDDPDKEKYKNKNYHPPLGIPMYLSGNFCELRSNHFHTGLDIKTGGVEGKKVYSIEDGYVSRVKVGLWGYGNVLYITHPDGFVSVYAHLQKFNDEIAKFVKDAQYDRKRHQIELFPGKEQLVVKKGEVIALSGNSGSSVAPHLHFEIRESRTEHPVNPLLFGFDIKDNVRPTIRKVRIYPLDNNSYVDRHNEPKTYDVDGKVGNYKVADVDSIRVRGKIGFAVDVVDKLNGVSNICGIYRIELFVDSQQVYGQNLEKMNFAVNRYLNAHMDYEMWKVNSNHFQRSFLLPNNKLPIYENVKNRGFVTFDDTLWHDVRYRIEDTYGNVSELNFKVICDPPTAPFVLVKRKAPFQELKWNQENVVKQEGFVLRMPPNILYEDLGLKFNVEAQPKRAFAPLFKIHDYLTPLQSYFTVRIKPDSIPPGKESKMIVVSYSKNGKIYNEKGRYDNGWITARSRTFGNYSVMMDDTPPQIKPNNFKDGQNLAKKTEISLKITDNLSGVKSYSGTIDGKWALFEYDPQRAKLYYVFDEHVGAGEHTLKVTVKDERGNRKSYTAKFTR